MPERETYDLGTPFLRLEREGHLAWCTIDRPASRNALSGAMYFGVKRAVQIVNAITDPTALLITGVGDVFAPGGELRGRVEDPNPVVEQLGVADVLPFEALRNSAAPVVSAVNGICQGGGGGDCNALRRGGGERARQLSGAGAAARDCRHRPVGPRAALDRREWRSSDGQDRHARHSGAGSSNLGRQGVRCASHER